MSPVGHHLLRLLLFFAVLFAIGIVAALRERRAKMNTRNRRRNQ
jgi:hypothetical protein